jgi:hypothetical protein
VSKFNFSVYRLVETVSRAGPQNVMFTAGFGEEATGQQWNIYWPVNNRMGAIRMRVQLWSSKVHFLNFLLNIYDVPFVQFGFKLRSLQ